MQEAIDLPVLDYLPAWLQTTVIAALAVSHAATAFCALTGSPPPNTTWGKAYSWIEKIGAITAKAKQEGVPVPTLQDVTTALLKAVQEAAVTGKGIDPRTVLAVLDPCNPAPASLPPVPAPPPSVPTPAPVSVPPSPASVTVTIPVAAPSLSPAPAPTPVAATVTQ